MIPTPLKIIQHVMSTQKYIQITKKEEYIQTMDNHL